MSYYSFKGAEPLYGAVRGLKTHSRSMTYYLIKVKTNILEGNCGGGFPSRFSLDSSIFYYDKIFFKKEGAEVYRKSIINCENLEVVEVEVKLKNN